MELIFSIFLISFFVKDISNEDWSFFLMASLVLRTSEDFSLFVIIHMSNRFLFFLMFLWINYITIIIFIISRPVPQFFSVQNFFKHSLGEVFDTFFFHFLFWTIRLHQKWFFRFRPKLYNNNRQYFPDWQQTFGWTQKDDPIEKIKQKNF